MAELAGIGTQAGPGLLWPRAPRVHLPAAAPAGVRFRPRRANWPDYLADLGVTHVYLLTDPAGFNPGSPHGYDVVDHSRISADLGGEDAFRAMAERFHRRHLGVVVDIVPNHMARPTPETRNQQLWSVLYQGQASPYAHWFDVDWAAQDGKLLMPILAGPLEKCLGDLIIDTAPKTPENAEHRGPVLRYFDHVLPLRDGVADLPLGMLLAEQHFLLADQGHDAATQLEPLAPVLRRRLAGGRPGRGPRRVRGHPPGAAAAGRRGPDRRPAGGPPGRPGRPGRLPAAAVRGDRRHVGRGGEDPGPRRGAAGLGLRGHHRLRHAGRGRRAVRGPRRRPPADRGLRPADRREAGLRRGGQGRQARHRRRHVQRRAVPADPAVRPGRLPGPGRARRG